MTMALEAAGATVVHVPLITIVAVASDADISAAIDDATDIVVTSANAAARLPRGAGMGRTVWAVGPETGAACAERGVVARVGEPHTAAALGRAIVDTVAATARCVLVQAADVDGVIEQILVAAGIAFTRVVAYRTTAVAATAPALAAALAGGVDTVAFASGSAVRAAAAALGAEAFTGQTVACIGPATAAVAGACGIRVAVVASEHTGLGLVAAIVAAATASGANSVG